MATEGTTGACRKAANKHEVFGDICKHVNFKLPAARPGVEWLQLPELPTARELNPDGDPDNTRAAIMRYLERNNVSKPYESASKYLETHYRLNREEGITFLRFGISEYKYDTRMKDNDSTFVYTKVFIKGYKMTRLGPVCRVQFSTERAGKRIRWHTSQRLMPGTVVAISTLTDNFKTVCKPAVVADRPIRNGLERKPPTIDLTWAKLDDFVIDPNEELVMIESRRGFFEAVRHTLVGLQHVARSTSPLLKYLVQGSDIDSSPDFVVNQPTMDLSPILHHLPVNTLEKARVLNVYRNYNVLGGISNDIGKHTSLDHSQLRAVHRILTKELAIIQGPPGTGKTFTSVESLRCMVNTLTAGMTMPPKNVIIVAAETNHAVDQILTHLLAHDIKVVRLGSRTRDDEIKKYSLFNLRNRTTRACDRDISNLETVRRRIITDLNATVSELFSGELLDPEVLLEHKLITEVQFNSLSTNEWTWQPAPGKPRGFMAEWLDDSLQDASVRRHQDPVFDTEDVSEDDGGDGVDAANFDIDMDDRVMEQDDDSFHLNGTWIEIGRKWAGANPNHYPVDSACLLRQLKKQDLYEIDEKWRGPIYEYWQSRLLSKRGEELSDLFANYIRICKDIKISRWKRDTACIRLSNIHVIGCTTTGLSKYRGLLAALKPRTILIEEAAQSREAYIAAALLPTLEQLVLVGDHQQLVPHCDVMGLADSYHNLTVSMFERLVGYLKLPYTMLNQQRRMIPEIRAILNPFYPALEDHPSVLDKKQRPNVPGMAMNSYLFNHNWCEGTDFESQSKYNLNEAAMVVRFAMYLIQNGVDTKKITILTFYRGQRKKIYMYASRFGALHSGPLKVCTVDSYQGEENDVVILSLVRSNAPNRLGIAGFVGDMNRGVVAISRARRGLYIFGNIKNLELATETSRFMWGNVRQAFERLNRYGSTRSRLPLLCQNHGKITYAAEAEHFQAIYGGCHERCTDIFEPCGHPCERLCHPMPHENLICQHACERDLTCGHSCSRLCGHECACEWKCPESVDQMRQPHNVPNSSKGEAVPLAKPWSAWDAVVDDAEQRAAIGTGPDLIDIGQPVQGTPRSIRDEHRRIIIGKAGQREVSEIAVENDAIQPHLPVPDPSARRTSSASTGCKAGHGVNGSTDPTAVAKKAAHFRRPRGTLKYSRHSSRRAKNASFKTVGNKQMSGEVPNSESPLSQADGFVEFTNQRIRDGHKFHPSSKYCGDSLQNQGALNSLENCLILDNQSCQSGVNYDTSHERQAQSRDHDITTNISDIYDATPRRERTQHSSFVHSQNGYTQAAPRSLTTDSFFQQISESSDANFIARTVNDWEHSGSEGEPPSAQLQQLALEAASRPRSDNDNEDLITF